MARQPRHRTHAHEPNAWIQFFFGSTRRIGFTLFAAALIIAWSFPLFFPILLNSFLQRVLLPILPAAMLIALIGYGFLIMFKPFRPKKKKNDGH